MSWSYAAVTVFLETPRRGGKPALRDSLRIVTRAQCAAVTVHLRSAASGDLPRLTEIYNWYVQNSFATFDEAPVSAENRRAWFGTYAAAGPHQLLVAEVDGTVSGYASSSPYRSHPAFSATVEITVYLANDARGQGLGAQLYDELLGRLAAERVHSVLAAVALPNAASVGLHLSRGFREVGTFTDYATKGGQPISSTWFEKLL